MKSTWIIRSASSTAKPEVIEPIKGVNWKKLSNHKEFFDTVAKQLNLNSLDGWYSVETSVIKKFGGKSLLNLHSKNLHVALQTVYPNHTWLPWKFKRLNAKFWDSKEHQKYFWDWVARQLNINKPSDWNRITVKQVQQLGGSSLLKKYGKNIIRALSFVYPEEFDYKLSVRKGKGYWADINNQKEFLDLVKQKLNIEKPSDWQEVRYDQISDLGGITLVRHYNYDLCKMLRTVYPHETYHEWFFPHLKKDFWKDIVNVRAYFQWLGDQLGIKTLDDWRLVMNGQVPRMNSIRSVFGGLKEALRAAFPEHNWGGPVAIDKSLSKGQQVLMHFLKQIFPDCELKNNYRHPDMLFPDTNREMELDIYIPGIKLAFEYQGAQHFHWNYIVGTPSPTQLRDQAKRDLCKINNVTLIEIPYWWNHDIPSLKATIHSLRPELVELPRKAKPIPTTPPKRKISNVLNRIESHLIGTYTTLLEDTKPGSEYTLQLGKSSHHVKCRTCKKVIGSKDEPRLVVRGAFTPSDGKTYPAVYRICFNRSCLEKSVQRYARNQIDPANPDHLEEYGIERLSIHFPPFNNSIGISKDLEPVVSNLKEWSGIKFTLAETLPQ